MPKVILTKKEEKEKFFKGMNALADAVTTTLGYGGKLSLVSHGWGASPITTKDGYYTAKNIQFADWIEDAGGMLLKSIAKKTADVTGDNTTTTTLLAQFLINNGIKEVESGRNPREVVSEIQNGLKSIISNLDELSIKINGDNTKIKQVATISANNDVEIGKLIADVYTQIGEKGRIELEESGTSETTTDIKSGAEIQRGYLDKAWSTNKEKLTIEHKNPLFFVYDYDLLKIADIEPLLLSIQSTRTDRNIAGIPIVIYANDFGDEVVDSLLANNIRFGGCFVLLKPTMSYRKECLQDVCAITGAKLICLENGLTPKHANIDLKGTAEKIYVTKDYTVIYGGGADKEAFAKHTKEIEEQIKDNIEQKDLQDILEKRLALISGSIGIIKVGGITEVEMKERKDRIEDAVKATKCAIEEGILMGGGKAFLLCKEKTTSKLLKNALEAPILKMLENADYDLLFSEKIIHESLKAPQTHGFNFRTAKIEDLIDAGVIDATKVVKHAIINACSVACQIISTGCFLIEIPERQIEK